MPVAADEPTYCYCGDVSYGEMIACENEVYTYVMGLMIVLSAGVVSFRVRRTGCSTEREMVLSGLQTWWGHCWDREEAKADLISAFLNLYTSIGYPGAWFRT